MKDFLSKKKIGFYFEAATLLFALVALISYSVAGQDSYGFNVWVDILLVIGIAAGIVFCVRDYYSVGSIVTMAFLGAAVGVFVYSRFMYYSHQAYGIASDPMTSAMIGATVGFIGLIVFGIISSLFAWEKKGETK